ncbi:DsrE family protein [Arenibacter latericius]|uniref:DsrE family protein n=1 Tax=Arenibacter latericius TaxID=86104 RepID=UPI000411963E|nr:DsrE family protein [Arenibacter latericius]MDX1362889.1 DsrE family protein [Arenibacter latericius]
MKTTFLRTSILILTFILGGTINAQDKKVNHYAVMTTKIQQLKPITLASASLQQEDGDLFGSFEVIIYGKEVTSLTDQKLMDPYLKEAKEAKATLVVCKMALDKFQVSEKDIPKEFKVVPNAFTYYLQLQKKGVMGLSL